MITHAGSSLRNKPAGRPAGPRLQAEWEAPPSAPGLGRRQVRLWGADAVRRSEPEPACWQVVWRARVAPERRDTSGSNATISATPNACMPKATVCRYPARFSTVRATAQPLLIPLRREGRRNRCLMAFPRPLPPVFRHLPPAFPRRRPRVRLLAMRRFLPRRP